MKRLVYPSTISGTITIPSSKSEMIRYIAGALLADSKTYLHYNSLSEDINAAIRVVQTLGCDISFSNNILEITPPVVQKITTKPLIINCGESALCCRIFSLISSLFSNNYIITGEGSLLQRNMFDLELTLKSTGLKTESNKGFLPIQIKGSINNNYYSFNELLSSQTISGLLFTLPLFKKDSIIDWTNMVSKPFVELTIDVIKKFGINVELTENRILIPGNQTFKSGEFYIEGDWSNASFFVVAAALKGNITFEGLNINSFQGDKAILKILDEAAITYSSINDTLNVTESIPDGFEMDANNNPDLVPPALILGLCAKTPSIIFNINRLRNKESDRINALKMLAKNLNAEIHISMDDMKIVPSIISGGIVESFNDHRIAMSAAIAGLVASSPVIINSCLCVNKSFPSFWDLFRNIGGKFDEYDR